MVSKQAFEQALEALHRHRASLQLAAEVDPAALREVAENIAAQTGLPSEVALRVVEDQLGVRPLPAMPITKGITVLDMPRWMPHASTTALPESEPKLMPEMFTTDSGRNACRRPRAPPSTFAAGSRASCPTDPCVG